MQDVDKYGVLAFEETEDSSVVKVTRFVEKPPVSQAPSNLINAGYFVLTPEVLKNLEDSKSSVGDGEIRIADALISMVGSGKPLYAYRPPKPGYDCGSILGFLKATVDFGLLRNDLGEEFKDFLKTKCGDKDA
jgi:UTP--glucose-1-phosphate uridylyltransferase